MSDTKKSWLDRAGAIHLWKTIETMLGTKVDKIEGFGLSSNDYTTEEKKKLASLSDPKTATTENNGLMSSADKAKLDGIEAGANKSEEDPTIILNKLNPSDKPVTDDTNLIVKNSEGIYSRSSLILLWNWIKAKADTLYAAVGHNHKVNELENYNTHVYNPTLNRTKRTVLAAPTEADGPATFRALDKNDVGLGNVDNVAALPLTGGTMTGNIKYKGTKATCDMITFIDNTADAYGNGIGIGGGGTTIIGGGESVSEVKSTLSNGGDEKLILANDGAIDIYTNCQNGIDKATHVTIDKNGTFSGTISTANNGVTASGSNYVRFGDGTQICWGRIGVGSSAGGYQAGGYGSFPVAFTNTSYMAATCGNDSWGTMNNMGWTGVMPSAKNKGGMDISIASGSASGYVQYIAIGRWK